MFDRKRINLLARTGATVVLGAGLIGAGVASAQDAQTARLDSDLDRVKQAGNVQYACTGVGDEAQNDPRWTKFPAKLVFAVKSGDYLSDVAVKVADAQSGEVVYQGGCKLGPWLVMDLPPGKYEVTAVAIGKQTKTTTLDVGAQGQSQQTIVFDADDQT